MGFRPAADPFSMRTDSRPSRLMGRFALPLALWAAVPTLQFCRVAWDETRPECLEGVPAAEVEIVRHAMAPPCAAACPSADRSCAAACPSDETGTCPARPPAHRTYCPGGPNGGAGVRPHAPEIRVQAPEPILFAAAGEVISPPRAIQRVVTQLAVRPPPRLWITCPPVRGPPVA